MKVKVEGEDGGPSESESEDEVKGGGSSESESVGEMKVKTGARQYAYQKKSTVPSAPRQSFSVQTCAT